MDLCLSQVQKSLTPKQKYTPVTHQAANQNEVVQLGRRLLDISESETENQ